MAPSVSRRAASIGGKVAAGSRPRQCPGAIRLAPRVRGNFFMSTDPTSDRADGAASMEGHAAVVPRSPEEKERYAAIRRGAERERAAAEGLPRPNDIRVAQAWSSLAAEAFMRLAENVRDYPIFLMDTDGVIIFWGEGARLMKWWSKEQAEGAHLRMLYKVTRDLTARHAADAHLQAASVAAEAARADAVAASAAKSGFLATISHEIRTPLNAILGYHELLALELDGPLTPAQRDNLERARKSVRHLLGLVNEVLDFSRIDAEREPCHGRRSRSARRCAARSSSCCLRRARPR